jgi:hypothetical protein
MRGDFKDEARRFEDIDIAAQRKAEEAISWSAWCAFCDKAMVAPDTQRSVETLAKRYTEETGEPITAAQVRELMPGASSFPATRSEARRLQEEAR